MSNDSHFAYPLLLDVRQKLVVIIGGGAVAARKARGLLAAGATRVRVVSLELAEDFPRGVECVKGEYDASQLTGAGLVFAATNNAQVNQQVVRDAAAIGALVNRADSESDEEGEFAAGDFAVPAVFRSGGITISIATGGSPALAAMLRDLLGEQLDSGWGELANAMRELRPWLQTLPGLDAARRRQLLQTLPWQAAREILSSEGVEGLRRWLLQRIGG